MTPADRRLAAAAACLAGAHAAALLARAPSAEAVAEAARLAGLAREQRLRELAAALQGASPAERSARARGIAGPERPRIASLVGRLGQGRAPGPGIAPALVRLVREQLRVGRGADPRADPRPSGSAAPAPTPRDA